jgi:hypothetical protein
LPSHRNRRKPITGKVPNMPKTNARADAHVKKAISFLQKCPAATVKEGMLIAGFSKKEIEDRAKQAWIYRRRDKADSAADVSPPESIVITELAGGKGATTILSVSLLSPSNREVPECATPPKKLVSRMTAAQKQKACTARLNEKRHYKNAFKRATITYAREKAKGKNGLSAKRVCDLMKEAFQVDLYPRTIQKKLRVEILVYPR